MGRTALLLGVLVGCVAAHPSLAAADRRDEDSSATVISVLSYNVHGLFAWAAGDRPRDRMPTIGWLANKYDIVLLQEDFEYFDLIEEQMQNHVPYRGNGIGSRPFLVFLKVIGFPFTAPVPRFSLPYGSGLTTYLRRDLRVMRSVVRKPFDDCAGWFGEQHDCWGSKGYMRARIRTRSGAEVDIYNTHIEAGSTPRSVRSRHHNLETLALAIETLSADRAVIVAGDFNVSYSRPEGRNVLTEFRTRVGLEDSGAGPQLSVWRERDFILYRSGKRARISVVDAGEATEFVSGRRALSDHPALSTRLRVEAIVAP